MKKSAFAITKKVLYYSREYWPALLGILSLSLLATPIALLKPYAFKLVIDSGFGNQPVPGFIRLFFPSGYAFSFSAVAIIAASLVILVALFDNITIFINWLLSTVVGEKLVL